MRVCVYVRVFSWLLACSAWADMACVQSSKYLGRIKSLFRISVRSAWGKIFRWAESSFCMSGIIGSCTSLGSLRDVL